MKLAEGEAIEDIQVVSTGSLGWTLPWCMGGLPRGRMMEIYGPESSGKTTLTLQVMAETQKLAGTWPSWTPSTRWTPAMPRSWA